MPLCTTYKNVIQKFAYWKSLNHWESNSMSSGILFHIIWNNVPCHLEPYSILAVTRRVNKKLTAKSY